MRTRLLTIIACVVGIGTGYAQNNGMVAQPTHVIGRRINAVGEITKELVSDFSYQENGKLSRYEFPEYAITASYIYSGDFITYENIYHRGGHPNYYETNIYTYENGQIQSVSHLMSQMGINKYWVYSYYDDGRLQRKDYKEEDYDDYHIHWLYDYEDGGKTVVESYYTSWVTQGMLLRKKTTSRYDDDYRLLSDNIENYNESGELTSTTQVNYTYTNSGMLDTRITQTLTEGEWLNTAIMQYFYDDTDRVVEQLDGTWDAENGEWKSTKKITFEFSEDGQKSIVSFYKKSGEEWVWDVFDNQTILFGSHLQAQQWALSYMVYEDMNEPGRVNQFEFSLAITPEPIYLGTMEKNSMSCALYPNPTTGQITITGVGLKAAEVVNTLGQRVAMVTGEGGQMDINISGLSAGVYFVNITDAEGHKCVRKVVKE